MAALGDMFAVASYGAYPKPTPTDKQRAAFAVSYGLLVQVAESEWVEATIIGFDAMSGKQVQIQGMIKIQWPF